MVDIRVFCCLFVVCICICSVGYVELPIVLLYKERAAPPIGGPALHDSGVKTVQWRKREGHDSYQEVEVCIYIYSEVDKYSSRNCGIVVEWFGAHTYFGNGL